MNDCSCSYDATSFRPYSEGWEQGKEEEEEVEEK